MAAATTPLPTGLGAFLFTDVVGSTRLWADDEAMAAGLARHDEIVTAAVDALVRFVERTSDEWLARAREEGPAVLAEETARWR